MTILLDIDLTLADNLARERIARGPENTLSWPTFTRPDLVERDTLMQYPGGPGWGAILRALREWEETYYQHILYLSGREEKFRFVTQSWLMRHGFPHGSIRLRADGDPRPDHECKREALADIHDVLCAVDDCGAAYTDPAPLRGVYAERGFPWLAPETAFGPEDGLRRYIRAWLGTCVALRQMGQAFNELLENQRI